MAPHHRPHAVVSTSGGDQAATSMFNFFLVSVLVKKVGEKGQRNHAKWGIAPPPSLRLSATSGGDLASISMLLFLKVYLGKKKI